MKIFTGFSWSTALGNSLLIILIAYIAVDIFSNKNMTIIQLLGKIVLIIFLMFLLFLRGGVSIV